MIGCIAGVFLAVAILFLWKGRGGSTVLSSTSKSTYSFAASYARAAPATHIIDSAHKNPIFESTDDRAAMVTEEDNANL